MFAKRVLRMTTSSAHKMTTLVVMTTCSAQSVRAPTGTASAQSVRNVHLLAQCAWANSTPTLMGTGHAWTNPHAVLDKSDQSTPTPQGRRAPAVMLTRTRMRQATATGPASTSRCADLASSSRRTRLSPLACAVSVRPKRIKMRQATATGPASASRCVLLESYCRQVRCAARLYLLICLESCWLSNRLKNQTHLCTTSVPTQLRLMCMAAGCICAGITNSSGSGGQDCSSVNNQGHLWCYVEPGTCTDGQPALPMPRYEWSVAACGATLSL